MTKQEKDRFHLSQQEVTLPRTMLDVVAQTYTFELPEAEANQIKDVAYVLSNELNILLDQTNTHPEYQPALALAARNFAVVYHEISIVLLRWVV